MGLGSRRQMGKRLLLRMANNERKAQMIVVDGRTDIEKLRELLAVGAECTELDYKETLDFKKRIDELDFVKDAVSMFNRYPGGYIIVGATDDGKPSTLCTEIDWQQFDGARLTDKIRAYVNAPLTLISALHKVDGHTYCLICMKSPGDGLLVPFAKLGQCADSKGRQKVIFKEGDITRRDGAQNRPIEFAQWSEILAQHDKSVREDEAKRINALIDRVTLALGVKGRTPPLIYGMDDGSLAKALAFCFEQGEEAKLGRFVNQLALEIGHTDDAIWNLAAVATNAILYGFDNVAAQAMNALYDYYLSMDRYARGAEDMLLSIVVAIYEIGAAMVLANRWDMILPFVNRQSPANGSYVYASWVRECQVIAVNAGKFKKDTSAMMISIALDHIKHHEAIIPEYAFGDKQNDSPSGALAEKEESVLNLLCSFDFLYCLCVYVAGEGQAGAYPACTGYEQKRINSVVVKVFGKDARVRKALLPGYSDLEIANGFRELCGIMSNEALWKGNYTWSFDQTGAIRPFLDANPASD